MKKHISPPFPQALHGKKGIRNASEILEVLRQVKVNIPLLDMIKQVPTYEKFLKDLCTIKRGLNVNKKAFLTEQVSAIIQCKSPLKYKDPGCPTISVMIGGKVVEKTLLDLGASVNLLPYSVYKQLGLVDFVVLDTDPFVKEANYVPIILGRPFLATSNAIINCRNGLMQLTFGNMTLELNIFYMSKKLITPEEEEGPEEILPLFNKEEAQEDDKEEIPKLNLKPLPMELKYTYLEENNQCPIVISSSLTTHQEISLLEVLKRCKKEIGWQISDLKGISPLVCTHHIYMEEEAKPIRQPQRRLNPHLQEVVRAEVLKLLQAGIIYPISESPWVSPTQVVPKKSGITVVQNEKGEEIATQHLLKIWVPKAIISDGGTHFCNKPFETLLAKYGVKHKVATPYHPQIFGQVELANREIKNILMKRLNMDLIRVGAKRCLDLNEMEELRNDAYINSKVAKQRMKRWHDQLISNKEFQKGQRVLLYDSRLHIFPGKLKSRWIGPFIIHQVHLNGVVELLNSNGTDIFKVNGHRLKPFIEPFKQENEEINLLEPQKA
ncbi:hypothetical protein AAG906_010333 [Vitis piasezkii]